MRLPSSVRTIKLYGSVGLWLGCLQEVLADPNAALECLSMEAISATVKSLEGLFETLVRGRVCRFFLVSPVLTRKTTGTTLTIDVSGFSALKLWSTDPNLRFLLRNPTRRLAELETVWKFLDDVAVKQWPRPTGLRSFSLMPNYGEFVPEAHRYAQELIRNSPCLQTVRLIETPELSYLLLAESPELFSNLRILHAPTNLHQLDDSFTFLAKLTKLVSLKMTARGSRQSKFPRLPFLLTLDLELEESHTDIVLNSDSLPSLKSLVLSTEAAGDAGRTRVRVGPFPDLLRATIHLFGQNSLDLFDVPRLETLVASLTGALVLKAPRLLRLHLSSCDSLKIQSLVPNLGEFAFFHWKKQKASAESLRA